MRGAIETVEDDSSDFDAVGPVSEVDEGESGRGEMRVRLEMAKRGVVEVEDVAAAARAGSGVESDRGES